MPDRSLDSLSSAFYPLACQLIARVTARGVAVLIVQTARSLAEHQANLTAGTSGTTYSLHLPRRLRPSTMANAHGIPTVLGDSDKADAIDLAPYEQYLRSGPDKINWDGRSREFGIIGEEAERLGLRWGGRWLSPYDPGHAELLLPSKQTYLIAERQRPWPTRPTA